MRLGDVANYFHQTFTNINKILFQHQTLPKKILNSQYCQTVVGSSAELNTANVFFRLPNEITFYFSKFHFKV
jgi:hypothetical protein